MGLKVYYVENMRDMRLPKWQRTALYDDDDETIYAPVAITESELKAAIGALWDHSVHLVSYADHVFAPLWWLRREYPETGELCDLIEAKIRKVTS